MGNNPTQQTPVNGPISNKQFLSRIQKFSTSYSEQYGNYSIYQLQQKPYSYYLEYIETSIPQSELMQQKLKFYNNMPRNKNLVQVEYAEIIKKKELCAQFDGLRVFCMYYNFTLEDAIRLKIKQRSVFTEGEMIFIIKSLLCIGKFYHSQLKAAYYSGIYQSKKVYISPEGHVKIYPFNEHIFSAYSDMLLRQEDLISSEFIESKKVSIEMNEAKNISESRNDMAFSKNSSINKSKSQMMSAKRSKLTTTLKKDYGLNSVSSKNSLVNELQDLTKANPKQSLNHQQSSQSLSYLYHTKNESSQATNRRDMFQLGLLMMQIILLNESHEYYTSGNKSNETLQSITMMSGYSRIQTSSEKTLFSKDHTKSLINYKQLEQYENDSGKFPNVDLIYFSLTKLLPKKNISKTLLNLIETIIFPQQNTKFTIDELYTHVQRIQQLSSQTKYCIKFDNTKQQQAQNNDLNVSKYLIKNKSTDPFMKTADLSYAFGGLSSSNQSKILPRNMLDPTKSKDSFFTNTQKLDQLLNQKNLTSSMIAEDIEFGTNSTQILSSLKKSRKLVPTKLRSISTKSPENLQQTQDPISIQRYKINF